ncbi:hypothetical protein Pyn_21519 [Prunus yedoensis var. nudiflora]|uniref:Uncharacterized protein n=1 Tax=Prunus yedoensis var. nudiflora TaxID=2094558 RepID=A0A314XLL8_PRUYE|nr:hypothetical protein Pyn_21519 [Prunus yedoensis var. nudiflora]
MAFEVCDCSFCEHGVGGSTREGRWLVNMRSTAGSRTEKTTITRESKPRFGSVPWAETSCGLCSIPAAGLGHLEPLGPLEMLFCSS